MGLDPMPRLRHTLQANDGKPIPVYYRLQTLILRDIENGSLEPGSMIPPERRLVASYGVSIGTVKKAILNLVNDGYLYRIQGKGTYVAGTTLRRESLRYYKLLRQFGDEEKELSVRITVIRPMRGFQPANSHLGIKSNQNLVELIRVFFWKDTPVVFCASYLPKVLFRGIDKIPAAHFEHKTLYGIIEEKYRLPTIYNRELIGAGFPPAPAARALGIPADHPVLFIEMLAFTYRDRPYEYRRAYCVTDSWKIFRQY
jgi:GntR family transcriptional regulator